MAQNGQQQQQSSPHFGAILDHGFPVDDCFAPGIGRPSLDDLTRPGLESVGGIGSELVTFEQFIRGRGGAGEEAGIGTGLRPIEEDATDGPMMESGGFFDIGLDLGPVPEDPPCSGTARERRGGGGGAPKGRRKLYTVQSQDGGGSSSSRGQHGQNQGQVVPRSGSLSVSISSSLRQSLCPTVGEGGRWLGVGPRRDSQDSAAYGDDGQEQEQQAPEEPRPNAGMAQWRPQIDQQPLGSGANAIRHQASSHQQLGHQANEEREEGGQLVHHQQQQSNSSGSNLLLSKFFCCFRPVNPVNGERPACGLAKRVEEHYVGGAGAVQPKVYSWDLRPGPDSKELLWQGLVGEERVKEPGQLAGNAFQIEGCSKSVLVLLDQTASVTIDDCSDCVILCGPCRGSIFLRDCTNLLLLAVCQQFRTRDCHQLTVHLFCSTCPTIEETDMQVGPLLLNYAGLQTQMHSAALSPFVNRWSQVHNFTPDTGKCRVVRGAQPTANSSNAELIERLYHFLRTSPVVEQFWLSVGNAAETRLFFEGQKGTNYGQKQRKSENDENALVLIRPMDAGTAEQPASMRFYAEAIDLAHGLLRLEGTKLLAMHDIDLRAGEWEAIIGKGGQNSSSKGKGEASAAKNAKKIVAIELSGPPGTAKLVGAECERKEGRKACMAELVVATADGQQQEHLRKQLYRLCEIRQSI